VRLAYEMTRKIQQDALIERFKAVLDAYGGDAARWPANERAELLALLERDPIARAMHAEAEAVDRTLAAAAHHHAPVGKDLLERVTDGALAAIAAQSSTAEPAPVISLDEHRQRRSFARPRHNNHWQAAGLLAASLVLGVYLGATGVMAPAVDSFTQAAGLTNSSDTETAELSFGAESPLEEELL